MEEVFSTLFTIIFVVFVIAVANSKRLMKKKAKRPSTIASRVESAKKAEYGTPEQAAARAKAVKKSKQRYSSSAPDAIRDSKDDWLSGQLREEQKALREVSAMFQLKASHAESCEAEELKRISRR